VCLLLVLGFKFIDASSTEVFSEKRPDRLIPEKNKLLVEKIREKLESMRTEIIEIYKDLHRHPEVSGQEERTAGIVAERLRRLGLEVQSEIGGHGVVGILRGEKPGPSVAYRADMDAVYSNAPDPVSFKSETPGIRHICGHDVHTTIALGIAEALASIREELPGTVKFIFQPAEENVQGARAMIEEGALENPVPEVILAVHCSPFETGQIGSTEGMLLAGFDLVSITFEGKGDTQAAAKKAVNIVSGLSSGNLLPPEAYLSGGTAEESSTSKDFTWAVAETKEDPETKQWVVSGLIRASSDERYRDAKEKIKTGLENLAVQDVSFELDYTDQALPAVMNDPDLVRGAAETMRMLLGEDGLVQIDAIPPYFSEDFALYLQKIPGVMYFLGVSNQEKGIVGMPHSPQFAVDEEAIITGAKTMAAVLLDYLHMFK